MRLSLLPFACILAASVACGGDAFFQASVRSSHQGDIIYLLMPDRFNNGDPTQNQAKPDFPKLDPSISFPVPPTFNDEADRKIKKPAWLNDPTVYHNRGEASTSGESDQYGDIAGLDDLFIEQPRMGW